MRLDFFLNEVGQLIERPLQPLSYEVGALTITEVDYPNKKYFVKVEGRKNKSARTFKELEAVFNELSRIGYCCVEKMLKSSSRTIQIQTEIIFANLPFINYFKYDNAIYIVFKSNGSHPYAAIEELSSREQRDIRRVIANLKKIQHPDFLKKISYSISLLNDEINKVHELSPGLLADTHIRELLSEFEDISRTVKSATMQFDIDFAEPKNNELIENLSEEDYIDVADLTDLVDLPSITGIDDGDNGDKNDNENVHSVANTISVPNIRRQTPSFALLYDRLVYNEIEIQPDYQRKDRIWSEDKKSKLIESVLMGLPLPIFYFGERKNDDWVVIDGLQRLTTIQDFMQNKFALKLDASSSVFDANGLMFKDFSRLYTRAIREFEITAYVIDIDESNSNKFITELFHRINTYGVKLSDQEIRSAINFGLSVYYLKYVATSDFFISATTNTVNDQRQKDLELCLCALAFIIYGYKTYKSTKYDDFLSAAMKWINEKSVKKVNKEDLTKIISESPQLCLLTERFKSGLIFCQEIFGNDAFKKIRNSGKKDPISKPLFEVFVSIFANASDEQKEKIRANKEIFIRTLYNAISSDSVDYSVWESQTYIDANRGLNYALSNSTGKRVTICYRFDAIIKLIFNTTGCQLEIKSIAEINK
ncbi:DUF262 domain-containing protein [Aeromonas tecta]|uniref:DUF262 domain-containing protein n=1 Tax=Aeromonas tecta TaxID=324617 RepID=UPI0006812DB9|nr:DUF262 domain-containing protein [Aeromonas tecta]